MTAAHTTSPDDHPAADGASTHVEAPSRPDGSAYRYEMLFAGMTRRAYADDPADLIEVLAPGYTDGNHHEQWAARLALAANAQVYAQAMANTSVHFARCTIAQQEILAGSRHEPVVVPDWDCPVPLVLIATDYEPAGLAPRPRAADGMPPNVIFLDPSDDLSLLDSLDAVGFIALHQATSTADADAADSGHAPAGPAAQP